MGEGVSACEQLLQKLLNAVVWLTEVHLHCCLDELGRPWGMCGCVWASAFVFGVCLARTGAITSAGLVLGVWGVSALLTDEG